jgi:hypothetical protein
MTARICNSKKWLSLRNASPTGRLDDAAKSASIRAVRSAGNGPGSGSESKKGNCVKETGCKRVSVPNHMYDGLVESVKPSTLFNKMLDDA